MEDGGLGGILWFLIWGGLIYFMMRGGGCGSHGGHGSKGSKGLKPGKTVDPVCGKEVDMTDETVIQRHDGQIYYFCSRKCVEKFNNNTSAYIGGSPEVHNESGQNN